MLDMRKREADGGSISCLCCDFLGGLRLDGSISWVGRDCFFPSVVLVYLALLNLVFRVDTWQRMSSTMQQDCISY